MHRLAALFFDTPEESVDAGLYFVATKRFVQQCLKHASLIRAGKYHDCDRRTVADLAVRWLEELGVPRPSKTLEHSRAPL